MRLLKEEKRQLEGDREEALQKKAETGERYDLELVEGKLKLLQERLHKARVISRPPAQQRDKVRFGAVVKLRDAAGALQEYQLVGVDEADVNQGKIGFVAPLARALMGRGVGERCSWQRDGETTAMEIVEFYWPEGAD
jgi:transcription elongation factor GreB